MTTNFAFRVYSVVVWNVYRLDVRRWIASTPCENPANVAKHVKVMRTFNLYTFFAIQLSLYRCRYL